MRIGCAFENVAALYYRGKYPMEALARRGHEIVWPHPDGRPKLEELEACDVVFVYRSHDPSIYQALQRLSRRGVAVIWDNDDNLAFVDRRSPTYRKLGGLTAQKRFSETVRVARLADVTVLTTEPLRELYERAGVADIHVIDNYLAYKTKRRPERHEGIVLGWVAGSEHYVEAEMLKLPTILAQLQDVHPELHVSCIGVDLKLAERYRYLGFVPFPDVPALMADWDIGIAPLVDTPFNRARSSIKVKEYAASSIPWLASNLGPYVGLGERQGGRLVEDGWYDALDVLIRDARGRKRLAKAGRTWAKGQTVETVADRYEAVLEEAVVRASARLSTSAHRLTPARQS